MHLRQRWFNCTLDVADCRDARSVSLHTSVGIRSSLFPASSVSGFSLPIRFSFVPAMPASFGIASQFRWFVDVVVLPAPSPH